MDVRVLAGGIKMSGRLLAAGRTRLSRHAPNIHPVAELRTPLEQGGEETGRG